MGMEGSEAGRGAATWGVVSVLVASVSGTGGAGLAAAAEAAAAFSLSSEAFTADSWSGPWAGTVSALGGLSGGGLSGEDPMEKRGLAPKIRRIEKRKKERISSAMGLWPEKGNLMAFL
jgi:hypothetical protein